MSGPNNIDIIERQRKFNRVRRKNRGVEQKTLRKIYKMHKNNRKCVKSVLIEQKCKLLTTEEA